MTQRERTITAALALLLAVSATLGGATVVGASHDSAADYTVELPEESDHYPGDQNQGGASIHHLAALDGVFEGTPSPKGFEVARRLEISSQDIDFSSCGTANTAAFGIDRGNDNSGTQTDEGLLQYREDSSFNKHSIVVDFYGEDAAFGSTVNINAEDEIVAVQNDCYTMPSEPGWYQIQGSLKGKGYNGNTFEVQLTSHYFYICECASEEEARKKLGPPPSEEGSGGGDGGGGDGGSSTPQPTATPAPESTPTSAPDSQGTATPQPQSTSESGSSSPTSAPKQGGSTPTATPASGGNGGGGAGNGSGGNGDGSGGNGGNGGNSNTGGGNGGSGGQQSGTANQSPQASGDGPLTPTAGAGPGFGALGALVALLVAALLVGRRDR